MSPSLLALSYFFHLMATVIWIGGLIILALFVIPEVRRTLVDQPSLLRLSDRLRQRFTPISNLCLVVLWVTGMFQTSGDPNYEGLLQFNNAWSVAILLKHVAAVAMIVLGLALQYLVFPALTRTALLLERGKGDAQAYERLRRREQRLTFINIFFAIVVLACTAYATAL